MVAELLDNQDLLSLHAVSREASANTRFVYGTRLFDLLLLILSTPQQLTHSLLSGLHCQPSARTSRSGSIMAATPVLA